MFLYLMGTEKHITSVASASASADSACLTSGWNTKVVSPSHIAQRLQLRLLQTSNARLHTLEFSSTKYKNRESDREWNCRVIQNTFRSMLPCTAVTNTLADQSENEFNQNLLLAA